MAIRWPQVFEASSACVATQLTAAQKSGRLVALK